MAKTTQILLAAAAIVLLVAPNALATTSPTPTSDYWFTRINTTMTNPTNMKRGIVPPAYSSYSAMVQHTGWIGVNALADDPGTRAVEEAADYWQWMLGQYTTTYPPLAYITYTTAVLGVNAQPNDLANANIIVNAAMA